MSTTRQQLDTPADTYVCSPHKTSIHVPVLLDEIIDHLDIQSDDIVLDGTAGGGGHAHAFGERLGVKGMIIALDQDTDALARTTERLSNLSCRVEIHESNFRNLDAVLEKIGVHHIDKALFDLGWSSDQIADPERGISFQHDVPLTMRLTKDISPEDVTAYDIVNTWGEETIADILYAFGDERYARRIARKIIETRQDEPIVTTGQLVEVIKQAVPAGYRNGRIHPATRTFQALRIVVNDEYGALKEGLSKAIDVLHTDGIIAVITFHSGEDRLVKQLFREYVQQGIIALINKKVITASETERQQNPRSRSAKLRIIKKL